jgi:hypothetical protein
MLRITDTFPADIYANHDQHITILRSFEPLLPNTTQQPYE